jgi:methyltransferase (TIGR00027 family)
MAVELTQDGNSVPNALAKPSALRVAIIRAVHQLLDRPLVFEDSLALRILGAEEAERLQRDPFRYNVPAFLSLRASLVVRSRLAEDEWADARRRDVRQYVILGAGLDTYPYRHRQDDESRIYEVDLPSMQRWKRDYLRMAGIEEPASVTFVPTDFGSSTLADALTAAGFRRNEPAFFSWLGVTMYLEETAFLGTMGFIGSLASGSEVVFDYAVSPGLLSARERRGREIFASRAAEYGEPWKLFFEPSDIVGTLRTLGFNEVEDFGPDELQGRYLAGRKDGLRKSGGSHLVCAKV